MINPVVLSFMDGKGDCIYKNKTSDSCYSHETKAMNSVMKGMNVIQIKTQFKINEQDLEK